MNGTERPRVPCPDCGGIGRAAGPDGISCVTCVGRGTLRATHPAARAAKDAALAAAFLAACGEEPDGRLDWLGSLLADVRLALCEGDWRPEDSSAAFEALAESQALCDALRAARALAAGEGPAAEPDMLDLKDIDPELPL